MNYSPAVAIPISPTMMRSALRALPEVTETLTAEVAAPGGVEPDWPQWKWGVARAVVAIHGIAGLLAEHSSWQGATGWRRFLQDQHDHIAARQLAIAKLLESIVRETAAAGFRVMPLKGAALATFDLANPGLRPMSDLDLLVSATDRDRMIVILESIGYRQSEESWKHLAFEPVDFVLCDAFGEHRDRKISIDLHFFVRENIAGEVVDITGDVCAPSDVDGLASYASRVELLRHLLLHSAADFSRQWLRAIHLRDISAAASACDDSDWMRLLDRAAPGRWWMFAPLSLAARYWPTAIPSGVLKALSKDCGWLHRRMATSTALSQVSASNPQIALFPGLAWTRSAGAAIRYGWRRVFPPRQHRISYANLSQRADFAAADPWFNMSQGRRIARRLLTGKSRPPTRHALNLGLAAQLVDSQIFEGTLES